MVTTLRGKGNLKNARAANVSNNGAALQMHWTNIEKVGKFALTVSIGNLQEMNWSPIASIQK